METRLLLTSYVVTTLNDTVANDGLVSLREAITASVTQAASGDAPAGSASNAISFDPTLTASPATLLLDSALPDLAGTLSITGPGADHVTIQRSSATAFRLFTVDSGATVTLGGLTLANGSSTIGGAILNQGTLTINNTWITANATSGSSTTGGGGISTSGTLTLNSSTLSGNTAASSGGGAMTRFRWA